MRLCILTTETRDLKHLLWVQTKSLQSLCKSWKCPSRLHNKPIQPLVDFNFPKYLALLRSPVLRSPYSSDKMFFFSGLRPREVALRCQTEVCAPISGGSAVRHPLGNRCSWDKQVVMSQVGADFRSDAGHRKFGRRVFAVAARVKSWIKWLTCQNSNSRNHQDCLNL